MASGLLLSIEVFLNAVSWPAFYFAVNFSDITAKRADAEKLNAAQQPDGGDNSGPTGHRVVRCMRDQRVKQAHDAQAGDQDPRLEMIFNGFTLKEVIPSSAKEIIFSEDIWIPRPAAPCGHSRHSRSGSR